MEIELSLASPQLKEESVDWIIRDLSQTIERETDIRTKIPSREASEGSKGEPVTIGLIILTLISSGTAAALLNILKSYVERESTLEIILEKPDGTQIAITAKNLKGDQIKNTLDSIKEFFEEKNDVQKIRDINRQQPVQ